MPASPPRPPLSWDDVRLFLALSRAPTMGKAAAALKLDASTMSRQLSALEQALDTTLFQRSRAGLSPTKAAEDLVAVAEEMEAAMIRFEYAAEGLERAPCGEVRITCPPDVAEVAVVPLLSELLQRHKGLRVTIDAGEAVVDLTRREADLALRTVRPASGDLIVTRLATVRWVLVAAPKLAQAISPLQTWASAPWVGWGNRFSGIAPARWMAKHVRGSEPVVRSDSLPVQLAALSKGLGVALVPHLSVAHYGLVPVKLAPRLRAAAAEWPSDELFLVTHRALRNVPRVQVVWDLLVQRLAGR